MEEPKSDNIETVDFDALGDGPDESQNPTLFTDAEEAKLSPDVPPISISQPTPAPHTGLLPVLPSIWAGTPN